ncbi:DUF6907 domain-containing protein [Nonomuraea terrae]|uniref:DUF6907 domain-containing protein n=1 Tax=Nonomuraea terrae TaxID=2530383 RepID=UPI0037BC8193
MDSITRTYDPATLTPTQLDGIACVACHAEADTMRPVGIINGAQVFACLGCVTTIVTQEPQAAPQLPPTVEARAHDASVYAYLGFKAQWNAEMEAYETQRARKANGELPPPAWLAEDPCPAWCVGDLDHEASTHPADRSHFGATMTVPLVTEEPVAAGHPYEWTQPELQVSIDQRYREKEARVRLAKDDDNGVYATLEEAEQLAFTLLDLVRQARGQEPPKLQLFDSQGRCVTRECVTCHAEHQTGAA